MARVLSWPRAGGSTYPVSSTGCFADSLARSLREEQRPSWSALCSLARVRGACLYSQDGEKPPSTPTPRGLVDTPAGPLTRSEPLDLEQGPAEGAPLRVFIRAGVQRGLEE